MTVRLLCDEMLARLGRWLRAAGHDTAIAEPGSTDRHLRHLARTEGRLLLTCDAHLARNAGAGVDTVMLPGDDLAAQVAALNRRPDIDWLAAPFSRCVVDNAPLRASSGPERAMAPPRARDLAGPFMTCPACGRLYWPGSHHRRMLARLESWQRTRHAGAA
jgi:uncharacterized protein with PIN domain